MFLVCREEKRESVGASSGSDSHNVSNEGDFKTPPTSPPKKPTTLTQPTERGEPAEIVTKPEVTSAPAPGVNETFDDLADIIGRLNINQTPSKPAQEKAATCIESETSSANHSRDSTGGKTAFSSPYFSSKSETESDPEISFGPKPGAASLSCDSTLELLPNASLADAQPPPEVDASSSGSCVENENFNANNSHTSSRRGTEPLVTSPSSIDRQRELARFILAPQLPGAAGESSPPEVRRSPTFTRSNASHSLQQSPPTRDRSSLLPDRPQSPGTKSLREPCHVSF